MVLASVAALFIPTARADETTSKSPSPLFCEKGKELLSEDFSSPTLAKEWRAAKGKWEVKDGAVRGDEIAADKHAAVIRRDLPTHNLIAEFSFRFDGGKQLGFSLNDKKGHVCRAKISPTQLQLNKDVPHDSKEKPPVLDTQKLDLKPGEWHTAVIEVGGNTMVASIDGKVVAFGTHEGIDVDKSNFGFPISGAGVSIKALHVWEAKLPVDPAAAMKKLEALHTKTANTAN